MTNFQKEKKIENKVQKLTNFTEKKDVWGQTNKLGLSLRRKKKDFLGQKLLKKFSIKAKNLSIFKKKKKTFWGKKAGAELKKKKKDLLGQKLGKKI